MALEWRHAVLKERHLTVLVAWQLVVLVGRRCGGSWFSQGGSAATSRRSIRRLREIWHEEVEADEIHARGGLWRSPTTDPGRVHSPVADLGRARPPATNRGWWHPLVADPGRAWPQAADLGW
jgi:hypothetical protein